MEQVGSAGGLGGRVRVEGLEKGKGMGRRNRLVLRCVGVHRAERSVLSNHRDGIPRKTIFGACPKFITWGPCGTIATWGLSAWVEILTYRRCCQFRTWQLS